MKPCCHHPIIIMLALTTPAQSRLTFSCSQSVDNCFLPAHNTVRIGFCFMGLNIEKFSFLIRAQINNPKSQRALLKQSRKSFTLAYEFEKKKCLPSSLCSC